MKEGQFSLPILIKVMTLHPLDANKTITSEVTLSKLFYQSLNDKEEFIGKNMVEVIDKLLDKEIEISQEGKNGRGKRNGKR